MTDLDDTGAGPLGEDFEADDFEAEPHYPFAPPQQWVILSGQVTPDALSVYVFTMAHLNPLTGRFDANFGRKRVAERFGRSLDWVDKQFRVLLGAGAMTRRHMWWIDKNDRTRRGPGRVPEPVDPGTGQRRAQAPNRWRVRMVPPGGAAYAGPIRIAEFYDRSLIDKRVTEAARDDTGQGGGATQRPPSDQGKPEEPQAAGGPPHSGPPPAATQRPPGAATQRPKRTQVGKITEKEKEGGPPPSTPAPVADATGPENDLQTSPVTPQPQTGNPPPARARARALAGTAACAAIDTNPDIGLAKLEQLIAASDRRLTQLQVIGRAARLRAWHSPPADTPDPQQRPPRRRRRAPRGVRAPDPASVPRAAPASPSSTRPGAVSTRLPQPTRWAS